MRPRRRTLLKALAPVALAGGGLAYWHRRWIRRRDEVGDLEAARGVAVPSVAEPLAVSPDHVEASYSRARDHVEETDRLVDPDAPERTHLERARDRLADHRPASATDDADRRAALDEYRIAVAESATARGQHYGGDDPDGELRRAHDALEAELDAFESRYRGESVTRVVVQCTESDDLAAAAASGYDRATAYVAVPEFSDGLTWETVEVARMRLRDAARFCGDREGPDRAGTLSDRFERLVERTDADVDDADFEFDDGRSQAATRWTDAVLGGASAPDDHLEAGRFALAVREQASRAVVAATLEEFESLPGRDDRDPGGAVDDAAALVAAKRTAVAQIEEAVDEVEADPLARHLLGEAIDLVERGDRRLGRLLENVRSYDEGEWLDGRDRAFLRYREAAANADAIPPIVREVAGSDAAA